MKIRPLHDRVVVQRIEEDGTSAGGIIIPDTAAEKPMTGKVQSIGNGKVQDNGELRAPEVKVGDQALVGQDSGPEVKVTGADIMFMLEADQLGGVEA